MAALTAASPASRRNSYASAHSTESRPVSQIRSAESYLLVRPPPSSTNHPLNIQIQLVNQRTTQHYQTSARSSAEYTRNGIPGSELSLNAIAGASVISAPTDKLTATPDSTEGPPAHNELKRTASVRSNRSTASSTGSNASGLSSRKTTPLYNLQFHKLSATTVTDAGALSLDVLS